MDHNDVGEHPGTSSEDSDDSLAEELSKTFQTFLDGLRANSLRSASLRGTPLDTGKVELLAKALQGNRALRRLDLRRALRKGNGGKLHVLAPALESSGVVSLDLSYNSIEQEGMTALVSSLAASSVRHLRLSGNRLGDLGVATFVDAVVAHKQCQAGSRGDRVLLFSSWDLWLESNEIGGGGARVLAALVAAAPVRSLRLGENRLGNAGVEALAQVLHTSSLRTLFLAENMIGNEGMPALGTALQTASLKILDLAANRIGDEGVEALAAGLPGSSIEELILSKNPIGDEGAKALAAALQGSSLERLGLDDTIIGEEGWLALLEGARDTAVTSFGRMADHMEQIEAALGENKARTFLLQLQVEGQEAEWTFTFRTLAGDVAAALTWSSNRPARDLPRAVFEAMLTSHFQVPHRHLRAHNLRILGPDGQILDCDFYAAGLVQQLAGPSERGLQ